MKNIILKKRSVKRKPTGQKEYQIIFNVHKPKNHDRSSDPPQSVMEPAFFFAHGTYNKFILKAKLALFEDWL